MINQKDFIDFQSHEVKKGLGGTIDNIKIILYDIFPSIFDLIDFENDEAFQEPMLYAYINSIHFKNIDYLKVILYSYMSKDIQSTIRIDLNLFNDNCLYIPNIGFIEIKSKQIVDLDVFINDNNIIPILQTEELGIKVLSRHLNILDSVYYDANFNQIDVKVEGLDIQNIKHFNEACSDYSKYFEWYSSLIKQTVKNVVFFSDMTDPKNTLHCKRNSFASFRANGISFHNCYQPWYDKVFFYDDIAHQMGHIIFYSLIFSKDEYFVINPDSIFESQSEEGKKIDAVETRDQETVFHALYTYYYPYSVRYNV
jgi:hypothetical protein